MSKNDNPSDHSHSDYNWAGSPGLVALFFAVLGVIILLFATPTNQDLDEINRRIDQIECKAATDETACLRDLLEDK